MVGGGLFFLFILGWLAWWFMVGGVIVMGVLIRLLPLLKLGKGYGIKTDGVAKGLQVAKGIQKGIETLKAELPKASEDSSKPKADAPQKEEPAKKSDDPGEENKDVPTQAKEDPGEETKDVPTQQGGDDSGEETKDVPTQSGNDPGEDTRPVPTSGS